MRAKLAGAMFTVAVVGLGFAVRGQGAEERGLTAMSARAGKPVIARTWHGKTPREKADEYEDDDEPLGHVGGSLRDHL